MTKCSGPKCKKYWMNDNNWFALTAMAYTLEPISPPEWFCSVECLFSFVTIMMSEKERKVAERELGLNKSKRIGALVDHGVG